MSDYIERQLTAGEIKERTTIALDLLEERDDVLSSIDEKRREIKELKVEKDRLDARIAQLRREVRSGKVLEPRQVAMGFSHPEVSVEVLEPKPARARKKRASKEGE